MLWILVGVTCALVVVEGIFLLGGEFRCDIKVWNKLLLTEKRRRIYYQDIVYDVCNQLDKYNARPMPRTLVCGTVEEPSTAVQEMLEFTLEQASKDRRDAATLREQLRQQIAGEPHGA